MKFCFPPHILFSSPPLSKTLQGKIFFKIGKFAEDHIADDYQKFTGRKDWYPKADHRGRLQGRQPATECKDALLLLSRREEPRASTRPSWKS